MTSLKVVNVEKLETLITSKWLEFIDPRDILKFAKENATKTFEIENPKIQKINVSNCEFIDNNIYLWIDYSVHINYKNVNTVTKVLVNSSGNLKEISTNII